MKCDMVSFWAEDGIKLDGFIKRCDQKTNKVLIAVHGMTSNCFKDRDKVLASYLENIGIDMIGFNNRGSEVARYIRNRDNKKSLAGMAYEDVYDSYYDVVGAIKYAMQLGYKDIYLSGHSLGCTKIVYTYNRMKKDEDYCIKSIKGIILLSLVDIANLIVKTTPKEYIEYANKKEKEGKEMELMPEKAFFHPISVKTFLKYAKYNEDIDFAPYGDDNNDFDVLNSIEVPLFMRWGNVKELIEREASNQAKFMSSKIKNNKKDISYIDGANHSYDEKEEELSSQICQFLKEL